MTVTLVETPVIFTAAKMLADALGEQIQNDGGPEPYFVGVLPGAAVPTDLVGCGGDTEGEAYTRVLTTYPSSVVGVADITPGNCAIGTGFDLEIGIYRCFPLEEDGSSPDPEAIAEASLQQMVDERSMRRALFCSDWMDSRDFVTGQYAPYGPQGGIVGGTIPVSALII